MNKEIVGVGILFFILTFGLFWLFNHIAFTSIPELVITPPDFVKYSAVDSYEATIIFSIFVWTHFWYMFVAGTFESGKSVFSTKLSSGFWTVATVIVIGQLLITELGYEFFNVVPMLHTPDWQFNFKGILDLLIIVSCSSLVLWVREAIHLFCSKLRNYN